MIGHAGFWTWFFQMKLFLFLFQPQTEAAVMAPPWANPKLNPCASQPNGWQLLFWPPEAKCYKIFQVGHPCPDGMELSPSLSKSGKNLSAECRCTPETAQSATDGKCYALFSLGPCDGGEYFAPDTQYKSENSKRQWGVCKQIKNCSDETMVYWPKDEKCYKLLSRGPCPKGQLLTTDPNGNIPVCKCGNQVELKDYRFADGQCYQHFTKGPCLEKGHLFLPDKTCGCHNYLPHYHEGSQKCFELGTLGPCASGQHFQLDPQTHQATCQCKEGYIPYINSTSCFRPFTQGPCPAHHILLDGSTCLPQPCERGYLYFPADRSCHRIGHRGPCPRNRIITFDFNTRPSVDGISYNGICACEKRDCSNEQNTNQQTTERVRCDRTKGLIRFGNECHKMYTQGPCFRGSWLVPQRDGREGRQEQELFSEGWKERVGLCECIPGYRRSIRMVGQKNVTLCMSPTVMLAEYLNGTYTVARVISAR
ncbi:uncharacterized protein [Leptinotarsa decemlineata]|uniref:uncharacterized protein n=1 Tax=Leptinotarsa decemlineata TaxID=7539 RepID=UPI003D30B1CD